MKKAKIIVHCLTQNEGRLIWYTINSVLPFIDKMMIWDMSSTDGNWEIIKSIKSPKIELNRVGPGNPDYLTVVRQQMLEATPKDFTWVMILDGDEVWPGKSIKTVTEFAKNSPEYESIVVRTNNLVGDIYHRLPESAGKYHLAGKVGHLALRFMNRKKISGLHVFRPHGLQGYFDGDDRLVQDRDQEKIKFFDVYYHHATHLPRSLARGGDSAVPKRTQKIKYELGEEIETRWIPEVFFAAHHKTVPNLTKHAPLSFWIISFILTIPRRIKRTIFPGKHGY